MFTKKFHLFENTITLSAVALIIIIWSMVVYISHQNKQLSEQAINISSYEECVSAGNTILESYPAICITKDGRRFVQQISNNQRGTENMDVYESAEDEQETVESLPKFTVEYVHHPDWATYTDTIAGFFIQYDNTNQTQHETEFVGYTQIKSFEPGKFVVTQGCTIPPKTPTLPYGTTCHAGDRIDVFDDYTGGSRRVWLKSHQETDTIDCNDVLYADVYVQGIKALLASYNCSSFGSTKVVIPKGTKVYLVSWGNRSHDETTKVFNPDWINRFLSTFKIL